MDAEGRHPPQCSFAICLPQIPAHTYIRMECVIMRPLERAIKERTEKEEQRIAERGKRATPLQEEGEKEDVELMETEIFLLRTDRLLCSNCGSAPTHVPRYRAQHPLHDRKTACTAANTLSPSTIMDTVGNSSST